MKATNENVRVLEMACVGHVLENPGLARMLLSRCSVEQFSPPTSYLVRAIDGLVDSGEVSPMMVLERLRTDGTVSMANGGVTINDCLTLAHNNPGDPRVHIETLARLYGLREAWGVGKRMEQAVGEMDLSQWVAYADEQMDRIRRIDAGTLPAEVTYASDVIALGDQPTEWCVPGLFPARSAAMLVAEEGTGKSTMLRQIGMAATAGLQPFEPRRDRYAPRRVLMVHCEDSVQQLGRGLGRALAYVRQFAPDVNARLFAVESHQEGIDLSSPHDQAWLLRLVREHRPDLLLLGPLYRITDADMNTEEGVRSWQKPFEPLLADGMSIVVEHHAPNGTNPDGTRALRPIGSSAIRRWFAQGISIRTKNCTTHDQGFCGLCPRHARIELWRGARDDEVRWPHFLVGEQGVPWWVRDEHAEVME